MSPEATAPTTGEERPEPSGASAARGDYTKPARRFWLAAGVSAAGLLALFVATSPLTFWEYDELLFAAAVERFQPLVHHPHPPGYPAYVALGKIANLVAGDPFTALVWLSIVAALVGFLALASAFRALLRNDWLGVAGALLFYVSAGMLVHASLPLSDGASVAFIALTLERTAGAGRLGSRDAALTGLFASLAVGCRPQLAVLLLPLLALTLLRDRSPRPAGILAGVFTAVSLAWLLPLVAATGGIAGFVQYQLGQVSEFAANDADLARSGWRWSALALRFVAHPWGSKLLSMPVLGCAAVGAIVFAARRAVRVLPLAVSASIYLVFAAATMDPIDGVRYALPVTLVVSLFATEGAAALAAMVGVRDRRLVLVGVAAFAVGSVAYVAPVVLQRHRVASPPAQAAAYAREHLPPDTVILFDRSMLPHAQQLFSTFQSSPFVEDFAEWADRPGTPVTVLADGGTDRSDAVTFAWEGSDAYSKLTRDHYRVVSLIPAPPGERYRAEQGVYRPERTVDGRTWRWLAPTATIGLPDIGAATVEVRLGLPHDYPWESEDVTLRVDGREATAITITIPRGGEAAPVVDLPDGAATVAITSSRSFVPADVPALLQRDRRALGVMLLGLEQRP